MNYERFKKNIEDSSRSIPNKTKKDLSSYLVDFFFAVSNREELHNELLSSRDEIEKKRLLAQLRDQDRKRRSLMSYLRSRMNQLETMRAV